MKETLKKLCPVCKKRRFKTLDSNTPEQNSNCQTCWILKLQLQSMIEEFQKLASGKGLRIKGSFSLLPLISFKNK